MADVILESWNHLMKSGRFLKNDDNAGHQFGINILDNHGGVSETLWYKSRQARSQVIDNSNFNVVGAHA